MRHILQDGESKNKILSKKQSVCSALQLIKGTTVTIFKGKSGQRLEIR